MATENPTTILAVKEVSGYGYIIRARFDGLIRYFSANYNAASRFPAGWNAPGGSGRLIPPGPYPADLKCIRLRRPDERDNIDPKHVTDYPIAEPLDHVLTGVDPARKDPVPSLRAPDLRGPAMSRTWSERGAIHGNEDRRVPRQVAGPDRLDLVLDGPGSPSHPLHAGHRVPALTLRHPDPGRARHDARDRDAPASRRDPGGAGDNPGLVPAFYGLVTERGRGVVGFLSEYIEGSQTMYSLFREAADRGSRTGLCRRRSGRSAVRRCGRSMWRVFFMATYTRAISCAAVMARLY
ncbi:uncharacterized protein PG986_003737 [Apiospora aurea]|uniref:Uncharacterized protein n=1 Tax=Apiospora aurea TaxID=335848 RepID=A0ABR1QSI4_9PEZI